MNASERSLADIILGATTSGVSWAVIEESTPYKLNTKLPAINWRSLPNASVYQGHIGDGSSVQKHPAGPLYPCVVFAQETPQGLQWGVITPQCQEGKIIGTEREAVNIARVWLKVHNR